MTIGIACRKTLVVSSALLIIYTTFVHASDTCKHYCDENKPRDWKADFTFSCDDKKQPEEWICKHKCSDCLKYCTHETFNCPGDGPVQHDKDPKPEEWEWNSRFVFTRVIPIVLSVILCILACWALLRFLAKRQLNTAQQRPHGYGQSPIQLQNMACDSSSSQFIVEYQKSPDEQSEESFIEKNPSGSMQFDLPLLKSMTEHNSKPIT